MGAGTSRAKPEFFSFGKQRDLSATLQLPIFTKIWSRNVFRCPVAESGKTFPKIFTLGVIFPQNLKSKLGQTGTSLRAGYSLLWVRCLLLTPLGHWMYCREILFIPRCSPRTTEFPRSVNFSVRHTVAELRDVKVAQFSDFGLFSLYKTPKTYLPAISLQPRVTTQNDYDFSMW